MRHFLAIVLRWIREDEGKTRLTSKVWARALAEEDALAVELFDLAVETLGAGIGSVVNVLDLELVVIGIRRPHGAKRAAAYRCRVHGSGGEHGMGPA